MNNEDKKFLWNLMPDWVKESQPGLCPTMYGTSTYKDDCAITERVKHLLSEEDKALG